MLRAEGLSAILRRHEQVGLIHGCAIARGAPSISLFADDCYFFFRASETEAGIMKRILQRYEKLSGQAVNYKKSNVVFSPNTTAEVRMGVCTQLEVSETSTPGKYLGMPMFVGRNKNEVFGFLVDRVSQKLQGWSNTALSKGGKLTLLKTAAQSIPNFWMNLFLLLSSVCDTIEKRMNGFWWGKGENGRGIQWMAWEKLCISKYGGGLGLRSLANFNTAMLAKQGWRIMNEENPLVSRVMKAKYFSTTNFLNAKLGSNPSYMWRSILSAQDAVKAGCRRRIGDGESTKVWKVPWLPCRENGYLTTSMPVEVQDIAVQSLIDTDTGMWDRDILHDMFNGRDRELIQRVPLPSRRLEDSWFWLLDEDGRFTVKSVYQWLQGTYDMTHTKFWRKMWMLKIPGKVANFLWRVCRGCLPTLAALARKQVIVETSCPWCHNATENDLHVLFECDFARTVWALAGLLQYTKTRPTESCFDVIIRVFHTISTDQCAMFRMVCWSLWNRRNKWVWEKANGSAFGVNATALNLLGDWRKAQGESDSKNLVEACKGRKGASYFHTIVSDCIELYKHFNQVQISFVCRSANSVAHVLATHSVSDLMEWVVNPPDFIKHVLDSDFLK